MRGEPRDQSSEQEREVLLAGLRVLKGPWT